MTEHSKCAVGCAPVCLTCGLRKKPWGRAAAPEQANSLCDQDCPGYMDQPTSCVQWPGEPKIRDEPAVSDGLFKQRQEAAS